MTELQAVGLYTGLNMILFIVLALRVVLTRNTSKVSLGDGGNDEMLCAMRAHANHAEWAPLGLIALGLLAMLGAPLMFIHGLGVALTVGRFAHAYSFIMEGGKGLGRTLGALLSLLVYLAAAATLFWYAIQ